MQDSSDFRFHMAAKILMLQVWMPPEDSLMMVTMIIVGAGSASLRLQRPLLFL